MSKTHQAIVIIFLIVTWIGCNVKHPAKEQENTPRDQQTVRDSIRLSNRETTASDRYPNALLWDSLNFQYTYAYQSIFQNHPLVIVNNYKIRDVWQSDSVLNLLCTIDNIYFRLTCNINDSLFIHKLIPNLMIRESDGWLTLDDMHMDDRLNNPWIVFKVEILARIHETSNPPVEEYESNIDNHYLNCQSSDYSGNIIDVID